MKEQTGKTVKMAANAEPKSEIDTLKAQVKELTAQLENQPKTLEERIQYFKEKEALVKKLSSLDEHAYALGTIAEEVEKEALENGFHTDNFSIKILKRQGYSNENEILKIRNPKVIADVIRFALERIDSKRNELQTLLTA